MGDWLGWGQKVFYFIATKYLSSNKAEVSVWLAACDKSLNSFAVFSVALRVLVTLCVMHVSWIILLACENHRGQKT